MTVLTDLLLPYPTSTDDVRPHEDIQALAAAVNSVLTLPDDVYAEGAASVTVTSTTGAALPTTPVNVALTNPSADLDLLVDLSLGIWGQSSANNLRIYIAATGGMTFGYPPGSGGAQNYGEIIQVPASNLQEHHFVQFPVTIPAGAAAVTFHVYALRTAASGTQVVNYPVLRVKPRRFVAP